MGDEDMFRSLLIDAQASIEKEVQLGYYEGCVPGACVRISAACITYEFSVLPAMLLEIFQSK